MPEFTRAYHLRWAASSSSSQEYPRRSTQLHRSRCMTGPCSLLARSTCLYVCLIWVDQECATAGDIFMACVQTSCCFLEMLSEAQVTSQMGSIWATKIMRSLIHQCNGGSEDQGGDRVASGDSGNCGLPDASAPVFHGTHDEEFAAFHCLRLVQEFPTNADEVNDSAKKIFLEQEDNAKDMVRCPQQAAHCPPDLHINDTCVVAVK